METATSVRALHSSLCAWRAQGQSVALVPTMGNLHAGHHALVRLARAQCDRVVASVFVNPTQFGPGEDFERYPRTLDDDAEGLAQNGCDLMFAPAVAAMYPYGMAGALRVHVPQVTAMLEGERRPGHFDGVATVVTKLLSMVQPDVAVFGRKDYQQWRVIERLCRSLGLPVRVIAAPIVRAEDGLALSSRNRYLDDAERALAPQLHQVLKETVARLRAGTGPGAAEEAAATRLAGLGFAVDYVAIRKAGDLLPPAPGQRVGLVVLAAARLGETRLIDNMELDGPEVPAAQV